MRGILGKIFSSDPRRRGGALLLAILAAMLTGASPTPTKAPSPAPSSRPQAQAAPAVPSHFADGPAVVNFLSEVIGWYRHLAVEERIADEPSELLFLADDRQMANEVLHLSFEFARAEANLLARLAAPEQGPPQPAPQLNPAIGSDLEVKAADADAEVKEAQDRIRALQQKLARPTRARGREMINSEIAAVQGRLDLAEARAEALHSVLKFEGGGLHSESGASASGLFGQIEELEKSIPEAQRAPKTIAPALARERTDQPTGIIGIAENLFALSRKSDMLDSTIDLSSALERAVEKMRAPLLTDLAAIDRRGDALAASSVGADVATLRQRKTQFDTLIERHKLVSAAAIPLSKETVILTLYVGNLTRWRTTVERRFSLELRRLMVRFVVLAIILGVIFAAASLWRRFVFSYVQDVRRRHQFLQARRIVLGIVVILVVIFNFATEIGALATVMGFAAAGIAVALQNVILSVAGYFFLIGKFGIKVGDRVQVAGVTGDVIDIGLVKLSVMELGGDGGGDRQPTGRVVVFSNAVVFQPSGNFFKQIPGTNFVWNEVSLVLAPECDYRLAEKLLLEAVDEVFARYRESIQRQYRSMARSLNVAVESPKPQSRIILGQDGIRIAIRYPAELRSALQTADEIRAGCSTRSAANRRFAWSAARRRTSSRRPSPHRRTECRPPNDRLAGC